MSKREGREGGEGGRDRKIKLGISEIYFNKLSMCDRGWGREMRRDELSLNFPPQETTAAELLKTFEDGELLVNKDGLRIGSHSYTREARPIVIKPLDNNMSVADLESIKVFEGGDEIVQLVQHKRTGQFFTYKVIQVGINETVRQQIAQELKIMLSIAQCPYMVVCYQCFYDNGVISIVLEYMDGGSLADFLKTVKTIPEPYLAAIWRLLKSQDLSISFPPLLKLESDLSLSLFFFFFENNDGSRHFLSLYLSLSQHCSRKILQGLVYLHNEKHIVHRDLKPSSIQINHRGDVKISDFRCSAILASSSGHDGTFTGTYNYMAPERISGKEHGCISDIWSLGLLLLECATGQFPYPPRESFFELLEAIVDQPPPSAPRDQFSPEFCSFISDCLEKNAEDRKSAMALLSQPFLTLYDDLETDLAYYFTSQGSPLTTF